MEKPSRNTDSPLTVEIEDGCLVIRIGTETLAYCFEESDANQTFDEIKQDYFKACRVTDALRFAKDIIHALQEESEDGTTRVHVLLDEACEAAAEDGSLAVEDIPLSERKSDGRF